MKSNVTIWTIGACLTLLPMAVSAQTGEPSSADRRPSSFIVSCDCRTPAKQARVKRAVERAGGRVFYSYTRIGGFAVTARRPQDKARLEQKLRGIAGVNAVQPDGVAHVNTLSETR